MPRELTGAKRTIDQAGIDWDLISVNRQPLECEATVPFARIIPHRTSVTR